MMMFNVLNAATWGDMAKKKEKGLFDFEFITWMAWTWQTAAFFIFIVLNSSPLRILNSYNLEQASNLSISGLDSIKRLDIPEITKLYMDIDKSEAQLTLSDLGSSQYQFLINLLPQANLNLIKEDVKTLNGKVSGFVIIGLSG